MRICLVSSSFYPATFYGGPISSTWDLCRKLVDNDVEVYVSTTNANGKNRLNTETNRFIQKKKKLFVKYYNEQIINNFSFAFIFGIWSDIKKSDIVYIQYLFHYTVLLALFLSLIQSKKIILAPRGSLSSYTLSKKLTILKAFWLKIFIDPFWKFINWHASSYLEEDDIRRRYPLAKIVVINDGVNFSAFQQFKKFTKLSLLEKYTNIRFKTISNIFFSMGRLHPIKDFGLLIDAFSIFIKDDKNAKLVIAGGDDGSGKKLNQQIINSKLQDSVFLIGHIDFEDKKILFNNCDYFTLASKFESFGIVIAEALSCGKPIIVSNKTPWKYLEIKKIGILVDNEKKAFANAFSDIIKVDYNSQEIKDYVKSNYDWNMIVDKFLNSIQNN